MKRIGQSGIFSRIRSLEQFCRYLLLGVILLSFLEVIRRYLFGANVRLDRGRVDLFQPGGGLPLFRACERQKAHIELDIVVELIKKRWRRVGDIITRGVLLVSLSFCVLFVSFGIKFVKAGMDFGRRTENADMLLWPFYVFSSPGFAFLGVEFARSLVLQSRR